MQQIHEDQEGRVFPALFLHSADDEVRLPVSLKIK